MKALQQKISITLKVIQSLAYTTDDTDRLRDLLDQLEALEKQFRRILPSAEGLIMRSTSLSLIELNALSGNTASFCSKPNTIPHWICIESTNQEEKGKIGDFGTEWVLRLTDYERSANCI